MGVLEQHQAAAAERDVAERRPAGQHVGGAAAHEDDVAVRLDAVAAGLMPQPDEVVAADRPAEQAGEEPRHPLALQHGPERVARRRVPLPQPELLGVRPQHAVLERVRRVERALRLHAAEELQAAGADGLAVEQARHEQVAVLLEPRPQGLRVPGHGIGGPQPPEGILGEIEPPAARRGCARSWTPPPGCIASGCPPPSAVRDIRTPFVRRGEDCDKRRAPDRGLRFLLGSRHQSWRECPRAGRRA